MTEYCFHCGEHVDAAWRFCRDCGAGIDVAPVATRSAFCTECGNDLAESWRYCVRCGTSTPVSQQARSVHLSPQEAARWAGVPAPTPAPPKRAPVEAAEESPAVELISRPYDVIDLRPPDEPPPPRVPPRRPARAEIEPPAIAEQEPAEAIPLRTAETASPAQAALPAPAASIQRYEDPWRLGQAAQLSFMVVGSIAVAAIVALIILNNRLEEFGLAVETDYSRVETAQRVMDSWLRPLLIIAGIAALGFFVAWGHRVYSNLVAFDKRDLRMPRHAALWTWLVPIMNLYTPRILIDDAWRGADVYAAGDAAWKKRPGNAWLLAAWLGGGLFIVLTVIGQLVGAGTVEEAIDANAWTMLGYAALIFTSLCAVRAIAAITDRQDTRARGLTGLI